MICQRKVYKGFLFGLLPAIFLIIAANQSFAAPEPSFSNNQFSNCTIPDYSDYTDGELKQQELMLLNEAFGPDTVFDPSMCLDKKIKAVQSERRRQNRLRRTPRIPVPRRQCTSIAEYEPFNPYGCVPYADPYLQYPQ
jgi:hypothetical protein